ncbi:uncharacterized protein LOC113234374 [Hyposmocoma kahamanoa]|uniref:uncharacterized protein LOC113234374 n=1 Tax=Hyposmocoma kahamanoa TaxID=1477025 RepID=UPI000E6D852F|nr:uncharacterized protein LOC113234374 [Hyposmocoma kahamanoa]
MSADPEDKIILPHHQQQELCSTRLPYRQGRKLTAVKVYTVNNESNHLLIFNVPSLNLRQETKSLFTKFGKLISFTMTPKHTIESFTETYHAVFDSIQSARLAKKMLDTKNFYGGSLHVCYAPEFESLSQTRQKIWQRQREIMFRLNNLQKEKEEKKDSQTPLAKNNDNKAIVTNKKTDQVTDRIDIVKVNMGEINTIGIKKQIAHVIYKDEGKRKIEKDTFVLEKRFKPCFVKDQVVNNKNIGESSTVTSDNNDYRISNENNLLLDYSKEESIKRLISDSKVTENSNKLYHIPRDKDIDVIDFTSTDKETISNINEALNYNKFADINCCLPDKP